MPIRDTLGGGLVRAEVRRGRRVRALGFAVDSDSRGKIAPVSRDRCATMLCEGDQGNCGSWVGVGKRGIEPCVEDGNAGRA